MTGLEKVGAMMLSAAGLGAAQTAVPGNWINANWPILVAVVAIAVAWGALTQRMKAVEGKADDLAENCASKESVKSLHEKMDVLVGMLNSRISDRRHE